MLPDFLLGKGLFTMGKHCQSEGLLRFVAEVVVHLLVIWLTQVKSCQE